MNNTAIKIKFILQCILIVWVLASCSHSKSPGHSKLKLQAESTPQIVSTTRPSATPGVNPPLTIFPVRISIPAVSLEAPVVSVGILDNGQMDVPESSETVGILAPGIVPGEQGTAVMAGHVDSRTGPAIFYPLKRLKQGDQVIVWNDKGDSLRFQVTAVESYLTEEAPIDKIFGDTDESRLHLITCTGKFNRKLGTHEKRLVVYTSLVE